MHIEARDEDAEVQKVVDGIANMNVQAGSSEDDDELQSTCKSCIEGIRVWRWELKNKKGPHAARTECI